MQYSVRRGTYGITFETLNDPRTSDRHWPEGFSRFGLTKIKYNIALPVFLFEGHWNVDNALQESLRVRTRHQLGCRLLRRTTRLTAGSPFREALPQRRCSSARGR